MYTFNKYFYCVKSVNKHNKTVLSEILGGIAFLLTQMAAVSGTNTHQKHTQPEHLITNLQWL